MKALILAGGLATRLRPITHDLPKCLIPIEDGVTIFDTQIEALSRAGVEDIVVVTGYRAEAIEEHARKHHASRSFSFVHNERFEVTRAAYGLSLARDLIGKDAVLYLNGDLLCEPDIIADVVADERSSVTAIVLNEWDEEEVNVVLDEKLRVLEIGKLIERHRNHGEFVGATKISPSFWRRMLVAIDGFHDRGEYQKFAVDSMQEAITAGEELFALDVTGRRAMEIDTIEDYELARRVWLDTL